MTRAFVFLRSVLPHDLKQLLLLFGVVCLVIAPHLRWVPQGAFGASILLFIGFGLYSIYFAGMAGFFICFRPGNCPVRRILCWVCLPTLMGGYSLIFSSAVLLTTRRALGMSSKDIIAASQVLSELGPGFTFAIIGLLFVGSFTTSLGLGFSSLPLTLPESSISDSNNDASWSRVESFLWVLLAMLPFVLWLWFPPFMRFILGGVMFPHLPLFKGVDILSVTANAITDLIVIVIAIRIIGQDARDALRQSFRWPTVECVVLATVFPVGITVLISVGQFLVKTARLTIQHFSAATSSHAGPDFMAPSVELFLWFLPAFTEEIIFRGLLQPVFVRRYGVGRGIFLVGMTFAAAHLGSDFSTSYTGFLVIEQLCLRLIVSVALSFVFGWLTLRSGSIFPAAIAHGFYNICASFVPTFAGIGPLIALLWTVLAYALFRSSPVQKEGKQGLQYV